MSKTRVGLKEGSVVARVQGRGVYGWLSSQLAEANRATGKWPVPRPGLRCGAVGSPKGTPRSAVQWEKWARGGGTVRHPTGAGGRWVPVSMRQGRAGR